MDKPTPGPWLVETSGSGERYVEVMDAETVAITVCSVNEKPRRETQLANALLIAAAPELLAALERLVRAFRSDAERCPQMSIKVSVETNGQALAETDAILAKVRG